MENGRVSRLREQIDRMNEDCLYRTNAYSIVAENLRETEGEPLQLRRAKAIARLFDRVKINVFPNEPIIGSMIGLWEEAQGLPSYDEQKNAAIEAVDSFLKNRSARRPEQKAAGARQRPMEEEVSEGMSRWALISRVHHDASLNYSDYQRLLSEMEGLYAEAGLKRNQLGKVIEATLKIQYDPEEKRLLSELPWLPGNHLGLDYEIALVKGLARMRSELAEKKAAATDESQKEFYEAALIVMEAVVRHFARSADAAEAEAESAGTSKDRAAELGDIAKIMRRLCGEPAESFREALQAVWALHVLSNVAGGSAMSFSRFDQYMLPFYEAEIERGTNRDEIKELLCCFWLKINEPKLRTVQSMTLGGAKPDGSCGANELTRLCLEVARELKLPYPNIGVRVGETTPEWLYGEIVETIKAGFGQPMLLNDGVFVDNFMKLGYPAEIARDYFNMGCVELMLQGRQPLWGGCGAVDYAAYLRKSLDSFAMLGPEIGSFKDFLDYYVGLMRDAVGGFRQTALQKKESLSNCYDPFCSLFTRGCVERGRDMHHGGSECPTHWTLYAHGFATCVDSLAAVKKFVYDDKRYSFAQLKEACAKNYAGLEGMRLELERGTPCYGNDDDATDEIAGRVFYELTSAMYELNSFGDEDKYVSTFFSYFTHVLAGETTPATPNGRSAGKPLSDGMSPSQGRDLLGPTKSINSALRLDSSYVTGGYAFNLKIAPQLLGDAKGTGAFAGLLRAYVEGGGPQIQVNFVDAKTMRDAQRNPESHRGLVVRVGGFCELFANLDRALQDEIIERTAHGAA
ncbi:MAG: pyruvate formate lyase [Defluviitaleaceae bacterium]|nr:pyruvate formate lyase [Defluviitaleaceae bacterium]